MGLAPFVRTKKVFKSGLQKKLPEKPHATRSMLGAWGRGEGGGKTAVFVDCDRSWDKSCGPRLCSKLPCPTPVLLGGMHVISL